MPIVNKNQFIHSREVRVRPKRPKFENIPNGRGGWIATCDRCGFWQEAMTMRKEWTGYRTCIECFEYKPNLDKPLHIPPEHPAPPWSRPYDGSPTTLDNPNWDPFNFAWQFPPFPEPPGT